VDWARAGNPETPRTMTGSNARKNRKTGDIQTFFLESAGECKRFQRAVSNFIVSPGS
jgi:hypothetical protein